MNARRESPFIGGSVFFLAGHALSGGHLTSELLRGFGIRGFWNHKTVIWNKEQSRNFWPSSTQWGSSNNNRDHLTALLHQRDSGWSEIASTCNLLPVLFGFDSQLCELGTTEFTISASLHSDARLNLACQTGFGLPPLCSIWPSASQRAGYKTGPKL